MKHLFMFLVLSVSATIQGQYVTTLNVDNAPGMVLKSAVEKNGSALLTEFNNAQGEGRALSFQGIEITHEAIQSLNRLWKVYPFRIDGEEIVEDCVSTYKGYQVRYIPILPEIMQEDITFNEREPEIVIDYDKEGVITDVRFALPEYQYQNILRKNLELSDLRRRSVIVEFAEKLLTAYYKKDMAFLENTFQGEDQLVLTKNLPREEDASGQQSTTDYLNSLKKTWNKVLCLHITFDDFKISQHRSKYHLYGMSLLDSWQNGQDKDGSCLFMMWDFSDEENPQIPVRVRQSYQTSKVNLLGLPDFDIK